EQLHSMGRPVGEGEEGNVNPDQRPPEIDDPGDQGARLDRYARRAGQVRDLARAGRLERLAPSSVMTFPLAVDLSQGLLPLLDRFLRLGKLSPRLSKLHTRRIQFGLGDASAGRLEATQSLLLNLDDLFGADLFRAGLLHFRHEVESHFWSDANVQPGE